MPCAHQIIRPPRPWASEALGWGDCITCTADARNAECRGFHDLPEPDQPPATDPPVSDR
jgi:hypothetical protein